MSLREREPAPRGPAVSALVALYHDLPRWAVLNLLVTLPLAGIVAVLHVHPALALLAVVVGPAVTLLLACATHAVGAGRLHWSDVGARARTVRILPSMLLATAMPALLALGLVAAQFYLRLGTLATIVLAVVVLQLLVAAGTVLLVAWCAHAAHPGRPLLQVVRQAARVLVVAPGTMLRTIGVIVVAVALSAMLVVPLLTVTLAFVALVVARLVVTPMSAASDPGDE